MRQDEFKAGEHWAWRKSHKLGATAIRVSLLDQTVRRKSLKVKVRHEEGELEGLEEWISASKLPHKWEDWERIHQREVKISRFKESASKEAERIIGPALEAAALVLDSTGGDLGIWVRDGVSPVDPEEISELCERAGLGSDCWKSRREHLSLSPREAYVSNTTLVEIAIAFAKKEPETVDLLLARREASLRDAARRGYTDEWTLKELAGVALARRWTGTNHQTLSMMKRVERLEKLLYRASSRLRKVGQGTEADRIEAEMRKVLPW